MCTKLEKYLIKNSRSIVNSTSTISVYYYVGNLKIRISDHFKDWEDDCDLHIQLPINETSKKLYIVTVPNSKKFLCWNAQQIIDYLPFLSIQKELLTIKVPVSTAPVIDQTISIEESLTITLPLCKVCIPNSTSTQRIIMSKTKTSWTKNEIDELPEMLKKNLKLQEVPVLNDDFKIFLMGTPLSYKEAMNVYDIIVNDNKKEPTIELCEKVLKRIQQNNN